MTVSAPPGPSRLRALDEVVLRDFNTRIFYAETSLQALIASARLFFAEVEALTESKLHGSPGGTRKDAPPQTHVNGAGDVVCQHGTAMDVHCCNCHSGFIFDYEHECEPELPEGAVGDLLAYGREESVSALSRKDRNDYQFWQGWNAALERVARKDAPEKSDPSTGPSIDGRA